MKKPDNSRGVIVAIDSMWGAIEWILPLCKYLKDNYKGVRVVFILLRFNARDIFRENSTLERLVHEVSDGRCYDMSFFAPSWSRRVLRYLRCFEKKPLSYGYKLWERFLWRVFSGTYIKKRMNESAPLVVLKDGFRGGSAQFRSILMEAKKMGCRLVRFPSAPSFTYLPGLWLDLKAHDVKPSDPEADLNIVDNTWDADYLASNRQKSVMVGTPKFDDSWIKYLETRPDLNGASDVCAGKYILILLKNERSVVFNHIHFASLLKEIIRTSLMFEEFHIVLKPHPRQDTALLNRIIREYKSRRIIISNHPSFNLIHKADIIIAMPSGVILDALIAGKPVIEYFHFSELDRVLRREFNAIPRNFLGGMSCLDSGGHATSVFRVKGLVAPADDPEGLEGWLHKFRDNARWDGVGRIRDIFPQTPLKKAADTIMALAC